VHLHCYPSSKKLDLFAGHTSHMKLKCQVNAAETPEDRLETESQFKI